MKIYNPRTKEKEEFVPQEDKTVKMYVCGPTVYDHAHIGNLRTYINTDLLRCYLSFSEYKVEEVMNVTDIDDKTIKKSQDENVPIKNVTQKYEKLFLEDLEKLNIELPEKMPHATDKPVMEQIVTIIQKLLDDGYAYKSDDGSVYYSVKKFKDYGKLSGIDLGGIKEGARVAQDEYDKENAQDFVLWKAEKDDEPSWKAPFGKGRPGWHIECTAMSTKYLGETIDIHAGGVDLLFPHHENEIAQSEAYTGKPFVKYWFHSEHLMIEGKKMSKSLRNIYTLDEMCEKYDVEPLAFRMLVLMSHYSERLNFTAESIDSASKRLIKIRGILSSLEVVEGDKSNISILSMIKSKKREIIKALDNDLNAPQALAIFSTFVTTLYNLSNKGVSKSDYEQIRNFISEFDDIFGLNILGVQELDFKGKNEIIINLLKERRRAKKHGDFSEADILRSRILRLLGEDYELLDVRMKDGKDGYVIKSKDNKYRKYFTI